MKSTPNDIISSLLNSNTEIEVNKILQTQIDNFYLIALYCLAGFAAPAIIFLWRHLQQHEIGIEKKDTSPGWSGIESGGIWFAFGLLAWLFPLSDFFKGEDVEILLLALTSEINSLFFLWVIPNTSLLLTDKKPDFLLLRRLLAIPRSAADIKKWKKRFYIWSVIVCVVVFFIDFIIYLSDDDPFWLESSASTGVFLILGLTMYVAIRQRGILFIRGFIIFSTLLAISAQFSVIELFESDNYIIAVLGSPSLRFASKVSLIILFLGYTYSVSFASKADFLKEKEALTRSKNKKLEELRKEMSHRVKNILQEVISNLRFALTEAKAEENMPLIKSLTEEIDRVAIMKEAHLMLYQKIIVGANPDEINDCLDAQEYLDNLLKKLPTSFGFKEGQFSYTIDCYGIGSVHVERLQELAMILFELVVNAKKHSPEKIPRVNLKIFEENNQIFLLMEDNGPGYDNSKHKSSGFGTLFIKGQVEERWKGQYKVSSNIQEGTKINISFPIANFKQHSHENFDR